MGYGQCLKTWVMGLLLKYTVLRAIRCFGNGAKQFQKRKGAVGVIFMPRFFLRGF
jgi:hypothetical protein